MVVLLSLKIINGLYRYNAMKRKLDKNEILEGLFSAAGMSYLFNIQMMSIWPVFLWMLLSYSFRKKVDLEKRGEICTSIVSIFFSLCCCLANAENGEPGINRIVRFIVVLIGMFFLFRWCLRHLFCIMNNLETKKISAGKKKGIFWISWGTTFICWLPYYLKYYPGVITTDSISQIEQVLGIQPYSNHHPFAHTCIIKLLYDLIYIFIKDETAIIGLIILIQMLLLAFCFSCIVMQVYKKIGKKVAFLTWIFYSIIPYNGIYSVSLWKDVWFAGICLLFILFLFNYIYCHDKMCEGKNKWLIGIIIAGTGVCLFRSNGYFAFAFLLLFLLLKAIFYKKKSIDIKMIATLAGAFIIATVIKGPVYQIIGVQPGDCIESLSLPAQNIACVIANGKELKIEEKQLLSQIIDLDKVAESYCGWLSDPIKNLVRDKGNQDYLEENKGDYFKLWLKLGLRYPREYLTSWINQTKGYWYPATEYWVYAENVAENNIGIQGKTLVNAQMNGIIKNWTDLYKDCPIYGSLWEISAFVWGLIVLIAYVVYKKRWDIIEIYVFLLGIWGTLLIATPVYAEFRYLYSLVVAFPFIVAIPYYKQNKK